jgi:hypothetical protein
MAGLTPDDCAETQYCDKFSTLCQFFCSYGNLAGARHPYHGKLVISSVVALKTIYRTCEELGCYKLVETAGDNGIFAFAGCYFALYLFNHNFTSPNCAYRW